MILKLLRLVKMKNKLPVSGFVVAKRRKVQSCLCNENFRVSPHRQTLNSVVISAWSSRRRQFGGRELKKQEPKLIFSWNIIRCQRRKYSSATRQIMTFSSCGWSEGQVVLNNRVLCFRATGRKIARKLAHMLLVYNMVSFEINISLVTWWYWTTTVLARGIVFLHRGYYTNRVSRNSDYRPQFLTLIASQDLSQFGRESNY